MARHPGLRWKPVLLMYKPWPDMTILSKYINENNTDVFCRYDGTFNHVPGNATTILAAAPT